MSCMSLSSSVTSLFGCNFVEITEEQKTLQEFAGSIPNLWGATLRPLFVSGLICHLVLFSFVHNKNCLLYHIGKMWQMWGIPFSHHSWRLTLFSTSSLWPEASEPKTFPSAEMRIQQHVQLSQRVRYCFSVLSVLIWVKAVLCTWLGLVINLVGAIKVSNEYTVIVRVCLPSSIKKQLKNIHTHYFKSPKSALNFIFLFCHELEQVAQPPGGRGARSRCFNLRGSLCTNTAC